MRLADFEGLWRIDRVIEDRLLGRRGTFEGEARFTPDDAGLVYDESGTLRFPGEAPLRAERRYLWRRDGAAIAVCFADAGPFHSFDPAAAFPAATHLCDPDTYDVAYDFSGFPVWNSRWTVTGPRKNHDIATRYRPA